ncbi:GNAT family N-acetyltransferase [Altibacter sp. HG106]|uniref:GNAT family N-acetyltransferase n=1 Tax=Altibacter sp. HG106 TaxID=3023937 RepID=UPI0023507D48|nr:GNAT family N-acetyltransferase [Altibacter sp. HG106]MDC7994971.1 GNAT family N-acetyltransferase [Altibacter sp. HG106]
MHVFSKSFEALTLEELYQILRLRSEIFVVEQDCVYQDMDNKDQQALHIIGKEQGTIVAYTRCFAPGIYFEEAAIGRVVVAASHRKHNLGRQIMRSSIKTLQKKFPNQPIKLSAQTYLLAFYTSLGFETVGTEYLEDGIPHIAMILV